MNFRDLRPEEIIQVGDEWLEPSTQAWWVFGAQSDSVGTAAGAHRKVRRLISPFGMVSATDSTAPELLPMRGIQLPDLEKIREALQIGLENT